MRNKKEVHRTTLCEHDKLITGENNNSALVKSKTKESFNLIMKLFIYEIGSS